MASPDRDEIDQRYVVNEVFARGGVGAIHAAQDLTLRREVAYKVLLSDRAGDPSFRARFVREARLAAQLQHPNILPVYDLGLSEEGDLYFAMKRVHGRTLEDIIRGLRRGEDELEERFPLPRLLGMFGQICQAVHYAHTRGVLHRDLKPANIMIGSFGEIVLMDWGLAKRIPPLPSTERHLFDDHPLEPSATGLEEPEGGSVDASLQALLGNTWELLERGELDLALEDTRSDAAADSWSSTPTPLRPDPLGATGDGAGAFKTAVGRVLGTPAYMAPEQARGKELSVQTDIYGLGTVLYEILALRPAFAGRNIRRIMLSVSRGTFPKPREAASPGREISEPLEAICLRAMSRDPEDRYATAWDLFLALEDFLQGHEEERRRQEAAEDALHEARRLEARSARLQRETLDAAALAHQLVSELRPTTPLSGKRKAWAAEDRRDRLAVEREALQAEMEQRLREALRHDPEHVEARRIYGRHLWQRLLSAERDGREKEAARLEQELRSLDDPTWSMLLHGTATLRVECLPHRARCRVAPLEENDRRLGPGIYMDLDDHEEPLQPGRYLVEARLRGHETVVQSLRLERGERRLLRLRLPVEGAVPEGFAFIPGGRATLGDSQGRTRALRPVAVELPDFAMQRRPVTMREYLAFLHELDPEEAWARSPRNEANGGQLLRYDLEGRLELPERDDAGHEWDPELPAMAISFRDAVAYARWRTARDGVRYRLPTDAEWEYAARTPDGRAWSWGDRWVPGYALTVGALDSVQPRPVGHYLTDRNPYGLQDLVGGCRDWCDGWKSAAKEMRLQRGGAWWDRPEAGRLTARTGWPDTAVFGDTGVRLVCSIPYETAGEPLLEDPNDPRYGGLGPEHLPRV